MSEEELRRALDELARHTYPTHWAWCEPHCRTLTAAITELVALRPLAAAANERAKLLLEAKNLWMDRAIAAQERVRDREAEEARLRQATVGDCASCGRHDRIVYFDREALVCVDYDDCVAFAYAALAGADAGAGEG